MDEQETKATNLEAQVSKVREAFYRAFAAPSPAEAAECWLVEVWDEHVIANYAGSFYRIPYTPAEGGDPTFSARPEWQEVQERREWVDVVKALQMEAKSGSRNNAQDRDTIRAIRGLAGQIHEHTMQLEPTDADEPPDPWREMMGEPEKALVFFGGAVKALGDGKVGGYLVRFSTAEDPDLTGDFFTKDTDFGEANTAPVLYHHGLDMKIGKRKIGRGSIRKDDVGMWIEAQLEMRDEYEKAVYGLAEAGKLGWSSGTASHLVEREPQGKAMWIKSWPLGLDASLTPTPAEPRNGAMPLKSLIPDAAQPEAEVKAVSASEIQTLESIEVIPMSDNTPSIETLTAEIEALKAQIAAVEPVKRAPAVIEQRGDDGKKSFLRYMRTGDVSNGLKTANPWNEGTAGDGGVLVPDDFYAQVAMLAAERSVVRQAGAMVITTTRDKITIPRESAQMAAFTSTAEEAAYNESETTPLAAKDIALVKYTRMVKISNEVLSDAVVNIEQFALQQFATAKAITENNLFMVGSGDGDPAIEGILQGGTAAVTAASATAITASEIVNTMYALPDAWQDGAVWFTRFANYGKIKALSGEPFMFQATPAAGPRTLLEKPVYCTDQVDAIAASKKVLCYGNPRLYCIAENPVMFVQRNPYILMGNGQTAFYATIRFGGGVLQATAFQYLTTASA